jgi:Tfp pilus assembly protein PilF
VNCHLGLCFRKLSRSRLDLERSSSAYRRELTIDPTSGDALNNLGILSLGEGRIEEAFDFLERAVSADPTHLAALANLTATFLALPPAASTRDRILDLLKQIYALDRQAPSLERLVKAAAEAYEFDVLGYLRTEPL